jgi:uncharacterized protein (DUF2252 family)
MNIRQSTVAYEKWLAKRTEVIKADLDRKHLEMSKKPFSFLRATFYRWAQIWPQICPELAKAPLLISVGDLHVENVGTWRDSEGRPTTREWRQWSGHA